MADINGVNYTLEYVNVPSERSGVGEVHAELKVTYDAWAGAAGSDDVYFGKLQAGARVLAVNEIGGGTAPTFNVTVGTKLSADQDLILSLDADGSATGSVWVEYTMD